MEHRTHVEENSGGERRASVGMEVGGEMVEWRVVGLLQSPTRICSGGVGEGGHRLLLTAIPHSVLLRFIPSPGLLSLFYVLFLELKKRKEKNHFCRSEISHIEGDATAALVKLILRKRGERETRN